MSSLLFTLLDPAFRRLPTDINMILRQRTRARLVNLSIPHHDPILVNQFCGNF
tara:strand:+ start:13034 stop:13192 length:159 start_codon:yes stop_codon:yes gene_type:complete